MSEIRPPMPRRNVTPEQVEHGQLQTFDKYLKNLGLKAEDLKNKDILDIGGSSGSFGDIAVRFGARVVSVDAARPADWQDIVDGDSKKLFALTAEELDIKDRLGLKQEPQFDYVLSHFSTPYVLVNEGQDKNGLWRDQMSTNKRHQYLYEKISRALQNIFLHLKVGGRAILYPLFLNLDNDEAMAVDFTHGEKRDVREFNQAVHEALNDLYSSYQDQFVLNMEDVPQKNGGVFTRLVIVRQA